MNRILVVEDEKPILNLIRMNLLDAGYGCVCAENGLEAADILEQEIFDLAILDIMLMCDKVTCNNMQTAAHYSNTKIKLEIFHFSY